MSDTGSSSSTRKRLPEWLKPGTLGGRSASRVRAVLSRNGLDTVCEQARCPNRGHCYDRGTATFLILGTACTRNCAYCAVERSKSDASGEVTTSRRDMESEPLRVAKASREMGLRHVVVTSVTRDDLPDGGSSVFLETAREIRRLLPEATIELLVPDFNGNASSIEQIANAPLNVFNHNIETVEQLFPTVRPDASYERSTRLLWNFADMRPDCVIKSGLMVGMGETRVQIIRCLSDLREAGVQVVTIGQYLQPTPSHLETSRFLHPDEFEELAERALGMGFLAAESGPLVRSSFHADITVSSLRKATCEDADSEGMPT
jgi:lipoic acid synthetase